MVDDLAELAELGKGADRSVAASRVSEQPANSYLFG